MMIFSMNLILFTYLAPEPLYIFSGYMAFKSLNQPVRSAVSVVAEPYRKLPGSFFGPRHKILIRHIGYHGSFSQPFKAEGSVKFIHVLLETATEAEAFEAALPE